MINTMNDLPTPQASGDNPQSLPIQPPQVSGSTPTKEKEVVAVGGIEGPTLKEVGREAPLAPEVISAGVTGQFTSVSLPQAVQQLGVKSVGDTGVQSGAAAVALPLTDDQIAQGLHQGIASSWRWLAEWCMRKLKQLHLVLKKVHGTFTRVKT